MAKTIKRHENIYIHIKKETLLSIFIAISVLLLIAMGIATFIVVVCFGSGLSELPSTILTKAIFVIGMASITFLMGLVVRWLYYKLEVY